MQNLSIRFIIFLILTILLIPYGCWFTQQSQGMGSNSARVELLLKSTYGIRTIAEPTSTWIMDQEALTSLFQDLNARQGVKSFEMPQIDFNKFGVLFLEMGQKPTGGYTINFDPSKTQVDSGKLSVHVNWDVPAQGMAVTQAVTSPFILLKIIKADINSILVLDQNKRSRFEIPIE